MRCDEVVLELAAPTSDRDPAAMAEHLSGCPACAEWARRSERLDRLWDSTRPVEPSPAAWDAVWVGIARGLTAPAASRNGDGPRLLVVPSPTPAPAPARRAGRGRRIVAVGLVGLAQAAAVLIALGLAWQAPVAPEGQPDPRVAKVETTPAAPVAIRSERPVAPVVDIEAGALMVIHFDRRSSRVEDRTPPEMNVSADIGMEMTNAMESIATPQVAAR